MDKRMALIGGMGLGAGLMFLLDPSLGRRRRHVIGERARAWTGEAEEKAGRLGRDLSNRARGLVAEARGRLEDDVVDDQVLVERVRAAMGRATSQPHALQVTAEGGLVTISGPVPVGEMDALLEAVGRVRGVVGVESRLEPHEDLVRS